jgi:hypothetical protein
MIWYKRRRIQLKKSKQHRTTNVFTSLPIASLFNGQTLTSVNASLSTLAPKSFLYLGSSISSWVGAWRI